MRSFRCADQRLIGAGEERKRLITAPLVMAKSRGPTQNGYYSGYPPSVKDQTKATILAVVRLYFTRIDSHEVVARANKNLEKIKVRFAIFKINIRVDLELQLTRQIRVFKARQTPVLFFINWRDLSREHISFVSFRRAPPPDRR